MLIGYPTVLPKQYLMIVKETYSNSITHNIELGHKWCELIIKNKVCLAKNVQTFLTLIQFQIRSEQSFLENYIKEHQAMGVYLHGEMILSGVTYPLNNWIYFVWNFRQSGLRLP